MLTKRKGSNLKYFLNVKWLLVPPEAFRVAFSTNQSPLPGFQCPPRGFSVHYGFQNLCMNFYAPWNSLYSCMGRLCRYLDQWLECFSSPDHIKTASQRDAYGHSTNQPSQNVQLFPLCSLFWVLHILTAPP